ncbi:MAG: tetratricopeptide repeat protein [Planctomycetota bacterium]
MMVSRRPVAGAFPRALQLALFVAVVGLGLRPASAAPGDVDRARAEQDRRIKRTVSTGGEPALQRLVESEVVRAEQTGTAIDLYLAGRILCATAKDATDGPARTKRGFDYLVRAVRADGRLWQAKMAMALVYLEAERPADARRVLDDVRRQAPGEIEPQRLYAKLLLDEAAYDEAIPLMEQLLQREADQPEILAALAEACFVAERAEDAVRWFLRLKGMNDGAYWRQNPRWPVMLAQAAMVSGQTELALRQMQELRGTPAWNENPRLQAMLIAVLAESGAAPSTVRREVESYLQRAPDDLGMRMSAVDLAIDAGNVAAARDHLELLVPKLEDENARKRATQLLEMLRQGLDPRRGPQRPAGPQPPLEVPDESPFVDLLRRCIGDDVEVRRAALQEYLQQEIPVLDRIVYRRVHHDVEPDSTCRILVARILGGFDAASASDPLVPYTAARNLAYALEDPDPGVRSVVAEELGGIGAPVALLYLQPYLYSLDLLPTGDAVADKLAEREYNAARVALVKLTGHEDLPATAARWVPLADASAHRDTWTDWFDGPEGQVAVLRALDDLERAAAVEQPPYGPLVWCHRYIFASCFPPSPEPVARRAYEVLRAALPTGDPKEAEAADPTGHSIFADFPRWTDAELDALGTAKRAEALRTWWRSKVGGSLGGR